MRLNEIDIKRPDQRHPDVKYEEIPKKKSEPDIIDSVVAYLTGGESGAYTKLAKRFKDLKDAEAQIKTQMDALNADLKASVDDLFPEADDIFTRVVDTASLIIKVGKAEKAHEISRFDADGYIKEIEEMFPDLAESFKTVREKFTTVQEIAAKSPKLLTPKLKDKKDDKIKKTTKTETVIYEGFGERFSHYLQAVADKVGKLLGNWDKKYADISARLEADIAN